MHVWHFPYRRTEHRQPLLTVLAHYLGVPASDVHLVEGEHGRPQLAGDPEEPPLRFNWSHGSDHAAVALARTVAPGIDIETVRERDNALELARRFFHPAETARLVGLPAPARTRVFLEMWTAKEAILKATGRGISFGLHRLHVEPGTAPRLLWLDGDDAQTWQLGRLDLGPEHIAAIAWRGPPLRVCVRALPEDFCRTGVVTVRQRHLPFAPGLP